MKVDKETIWHFICQYCSGYWSIATMEDKWIPTKLYCPYCGKENENSSIK